MAQEKAVVARVDKVNDPKEIQELWELYDGAFEKINEESPCRQSYTEREFRKALRDSDIKKFILRAGSGEIMGLGLVTNNLNKVSWISQAFYKKHYPLHFKNQMIYYIQCLAVSCKVQNRIKLGSILLAYMINSFPKGSIGCFDYSEKMNKVMPMFVQRIGRAKARNGELLDKQVYYVFEKGLDG